MGDYQEKRAGQAWDKLIVLQTLFDGLSQTNDDAGLFQGLSEITRSVIHDVKAACDCVKSHPELGDFETSVLEKELESRRRLDALLAEQEKERAPGQTLADEIPEAQE